MNVGMTMAMRKPSNSWNVNAHIHSHIPFEEQAETLTRTWEQCVLGVISLLNFKLFRCALLKQMRLYMQATPETLADMAACRPKSDVC